MSTFSLPKFAKTNGKTQRVTESDSPVTSSPSFFKTIKDKLGRTNGVFGGSQTLERDRDDPDSPDSRFYFSKISGNTTIRTVNAFAWVRSTTL